MTIIDSSAVTGDTGVLPIFKSFRYMCRGLSALAKYYYNAEDRDFLLGNAEEWQLKYKNTSNADKPNKNYSHS